MTDNVYDDLITGSLFKQPFFAKTKSSSRLNVHGWTKRFFVFNRKNMLLQYWQAEEERSYTHEGSVRTRPRGTVGLLSAQLVVRKGQAEKSLFGPNRFPIILSNGPLFDGKQLILAATSEYLQSKWYNMLTSAVDMLKQKHEVEFLSTDIIADCYDLNYCSLDNLHRILIKSEAALLDCESKKKRLETMLKLADVKNEMKYEHSLRLAKVHRDEENKLYSVQAKIKAPKFYYKYIITTVAYEDGSGWKRDEEQDNKKTYGEDYIYSRWFINKGMVSAQENLEPDLGKEFDIPEVNPAKNFISYDVRKLSDPNDMDIISLREMEVFNILKRKNNFQAQQKINEFLNNTTDTKE